MHADYVRGTVCMLPYFPAHKTHFFSRKNVT